MRAGRLSAAAIALALIAMSGPVVAAGDGSPVYASFAEDERFAAPPDRSSSGVERRVVEIGAGRSVPVDLSEAAADIYVAEPKVAVAVIRTARRVVVTGVGDGSTTVLVSAADGRPIATIEVRVVRDSGTAASALRSALPHARITVRYAGDSLVLSGTVNSAADATQAVDIARGFVAAPDKVVNALTIRQRDQVMLRVTVAEVQRNVLKQLGVNGLGQWQLGPVTLAGVMDNPFAVAGQALSGTNASVTGSNGSTLSISAMEQVGVARSLAEPVLTAASGETANFVVGGEVPVPTGITCSSTNNCQPSIEFKKFGVSLSFTPVVLSEGRISLRVSTEVSEPDNQNQLSYQVSGGSTLTIPGFKVRKQDTTVELPSGGTLVTAGLIQEGGKQALTGVPGFMSIPILGALARSRDYQRQETELVIIVQPVLARPMEARQATRPDQGFADAPDPRALFLGQVNRVRGGQQPPLPADLNAFSGHLGFILDLD
ncbi:MULTISPECIES: type II and III secretion system protein family protein [unclassified Xanthobacter]|uniref:type II and III secretion system protein family protein n=1 Tax=unclassified Xanthobacter TaxID=2623496 RepID=UPI001F24DA98|nr:MULTISPECIES: type II and III secretion system protein family protein [unclassified Xanthobacter]